MLPDDQYAELWQSMEYEKKPFQEDTPAHFTRKHERVRSKSEVLIADALYKAGIPYRYEYPLALGSQVIHPDFTILRMSDRKILYWDHLGIMDDTIYARNAVQRIYDYETHGFFVGDTLIISMETGKLPLNSMTIERTIRHFILS